MLVTEFPPEVPYREAEENLRIIRDLMERSTKHSTFSGLSGVLAGAVSIVGCLIHRFYVLTLPGESRTIPFLITWTLVIAVAIGGDYLLTKRKARLVGKTIVSRLGKQMVVASAPGLGFGALLTWHFLSAGRMDELFPYWMLCYGVAVCAVSLFSQREVARLGWAFLAAGAITLLITMAGPASMRHDLGWLAMAVSFGGFHIVYGIGVSKRDGW